MSADAPLAPQSLVPLDEVRVADAASRALVLAAARRSERVVSVARLIFALAIGVRSFAIWQASGWQREAMRALVAFPAIGLAVAFSLVTLRQRYDARHTERVLLASVAVDAVTVFAALLTNPLWPWEGYLGLVNMPDLGILLVIAFASGLRLSPRAALLGSGLSLGAYGILVAVDRAVSGASVPVLAHHYVLYAMLVAGAGVLAVIMAVRTRSLVEAAARDAVRAERAARNLDHLMHEHHDVRTLLSAVHLRAQLLDEALASTPDTTREQVREMCADLAAVNSLVDRIKVRSYGELKSLEGLGVVPLGAALEAAAALLGARAPRLELDADARDTRVQIAGGAPALQRVLFNLLANAREAVPDERAVTVQVHVRREPEAGRVCVVLVDDGPGFPDPMLGSVDGREHTGGGIGLGLVASIVRASGGELALGRAQTPGGGARVELRLATGR